MRNLIIPAATVSLAAGSSSVDTVNSSSDDTEDGQYLFDTKLMNAIELSDNFFETTQPIGSPNDLPETGSATFNGPIAFPISSEADTVILGDMSLTVNFDPVVNPFSGSTDGFVSDTGEQFTGALEISNGAFADPFSYGAGFVADLDGNLMNVKPVRSTWMEPCRAPMAHQLRTPVRWWV